MSGNEIEVPPRPFSLKQLLFAMFWWCVGLGLSSFAVRPNRISMRATDDVLATVDSVARIGSLVVGATCLFVGIIVLLCGRGKGRALIKVLLGSLAGLVVER